MPSQPKRITTSSRVGLTMPVGRIHKIVKKGYYAPRISVTAAVHLAAVLQYLSLQMLESAAERAVVENQQKKKKIRITPRHILLAVRTDAELNKLLEGVIICKGGVLPHIESPLRPIRRSNEHT